MLARFRADPSLVRVSIRYLGDRTWCAKVQSRATGEGVMWLATSARKALALALRDADAMRLPGVDISMGRTYEHPQKPEAA